MDEAVGTDDCATIDEKPDQKRPLARRAEVDPFPIPKELDRSENPDAQAHAFLPTTLPTEPLSMLRASIDCDGGSSKR